jgi:hypothetical protein
MSDRILCDRKRVSLAIVKCRIYVYQSNTGAELTIPFASSFYTIVLYPTPRIALVRYKWGGLLYYLPVIPTQYVAACYMHYTGAKPNAKGTGRHHVV